MTKYKKISSVLIFNDKNELLLQLRAEGDDSYPLHWDFSAGGGIDEGEDDKFSAEREIKEEIGVNAEVEFVTKENVTYKTWNSNNNTQLDLFIYKSHHNGPFNPDPKEVQKVAFFNLEKIQEMIDSGEKFHSKFIDCWDKGIIAKAINS